MSAPPTVVHPAEPPGPGQAPTVRHPATPSQLAWLDGQLRDWSAEGIVDGRTADTIRARYVAHRRVTLARIVLTLGALFVGLGLIWLVAANLDQLSPGLRFGLVALVWLGLVAVAEVLAGRHEPADDSASPVVGAVRLLAAGAFGAVLFQAAQSLQVPAYEPVLLGLWAAGSLLYAYAVAGMGPAVLGIVTGASWLVWQSVDGAEDVLGVTVAVAATAVLAVAAGALHHRLRGSADAWRDLGVPWREIGAVLALGALFVAALPFEGHRAGGTTRAWVLVGLACVLAVVAVLTADRLGRLEVGLAALVLVLVLVLALWRTSSGLAGSGDPSVTDWARAVVAVGVYLGAASGYAVLGGMRDSGRLTWIATAALVVFTTTQAFAVFAPILSGAVLFLAVGIVLLGTGILADRGRRRLVREGREART